MQQPEVILVDRSGLLCKNCRLNMLLPCKINGTDPKEWVICPRCNVRLDRYVATQEVNWNVEVRLANSPNSIITKLNQIREKHKKQEKKCTDIILSDKPRIIGGVLPKLPVKATLVGKRFEYPSR